MQVARNGELKKDIGTFVAMSIVIGTVIGSGIFMKPGIVISSAGGSSQALWAWVIGGIITIAGGLTIAEVGTKIPRTGGLYVYLEEVYGEVWGFLSGWVQTIIYGPAIIGALALYFATLFTNLFGLSVKWDLPVGIFAIVLLAILNSLGTKYGGFIQLAATIGKLIPILLIAVFGIWKGQHQILAMPGAGGTHTSFGEAVLSTLWAYDGWMLIGFVAGELKNPGKILPRAIIIGLSIVTAAYLCVNVAMLHVLPAKQIVALGPNSAGSAAAMLFGTIGGKLINVGILVSIFGCLNGKIMTFPRVPFAMAERKQLPGSQVLAKINRSSRTPINATVLQVILAVLFMLMSDPNRLSDIAIFAVYIFYIQAFLAVFILRRKGTGSISTYRVPLYPVIPVVAVIGAGYVVISTIFNNPTDSLSSIGLAIVGLPIYWILNRRNRAKGTEVDSIQA